MSAPERKVRDECGVVGIHAPKAGSLAILALHALQHRGQESAGIATFDGSGSVHLHKDMGLVDRVFSGILPLPGEWAVGHNRYSTSAASVRANAGPFMAETDLGPVVLAHNGNIINAPALRSLLRDGYPPVDGLLPAGSPRGCSDSELLALLLRAAEGRDWPDRLRWMASLARGSYSLVLLAGEQLFGMRDPMGNRPLTIGRIPGGWTIASESCAFAILGGQVVRDVLPGEIVRIDRDGLRSEGRLPATRGAFCAFEYIYIARPDTVFAGRDVHSIRRAIGEELGREAPVAADLAIGVPDSGTSAALGYAAATGLPFGEGLIKNRYIGRTFIQPAQTERERLIRMKFGALPLHGKRIVLVDDSIVRGNTLRPIVGLLRDAGATEIHVRIASPPITDPCYLGVDMHSRDELIANRFLKGAGPNERGAGPLDEEGMAEYTGADSLHHLSVDGLLRAIRGSRGDRCLACFTGQYPLSLDETVVGAGRQHPEGARRPLPIEEPVPRVEIAV